MNGEIKMACGKINTLNGEINGKIKTAHGEINLKNNEVI